MCVIFIKKINLVLIKKILIKIKILLLIICFIDFLDIVIMLIVMKIKCNIY